MIPDITLTDSELAAISDIHVRSTGPLGSVYDLERYSDRHRNIMHTNNN